MQERQKRGEEWQPRWYKALPTDADTLPGEYSNDECPQVHPRACCIFAGCDEAPAVHQAPSLLCITLLCPRADRVTSHPPPQFEFTGDYLKLDDRPASLPEEVQGAGFSPWCYPELHSLLGKETQRP